MSQLLKSIMPNHVSKEIMKRLIEEGFLLDNEDFKLFIDTDENTLLVAVFKLSPNTISVVLNGKGEGFTFNKDDLDSFEIAYQGTITYIRENMLH